MRERPTRSMRRSARMAGPAPCRQSELPRCHCAPRPHKFSAEKPFRTSCPQRPHRAATARPDRSAAETTLLRPTAPSVIQLRITPLRHDRDLVVLLPAALPSPAGRRFSFNGLLTQAIVTRQSGRSPTAAPWPSDWRFIQTRPKERLSPETGQATPYLIVIEPRCIPVRRGFRVVAAIGRFVYCRATKPTTGRRNDEAKALSSGRVFARMFRLRPADRAFSVAGASGAPFRVARGSKHVVDAFCRHSGA